MVRPGYFVDKEFMLLMEKTAVSVAFQPRLACLARGFQGAHLQAVILHPALQIVIPSPQPPM